MPSWVYKALQRQYQDADSDDVLTDSELLELRNSYTSGRMGSIAALTERLAEGEMSLGRYEQEMRQTLRIMHLVEYSLGRGGQDMMLPSDYGMVGRTLRDQYGYLRRFVEDVSAGELTGPQMLARADLYGGAATGSFERGRARSWGATLPAYPGDGGTTCLGNCRCAWSYDERMDAGPYGELHCTWVLDPGAREHCDGCLSRAAEYSPYIIRYTA